MDLEVGTVKLGCPIVATAVEASSRPVTEDMPAGKVVSAAGFVGTAAASA